MREVKKYAGKGSIRVLAAAHPIQQGGYAFFRQSQGKHLLLNIAQVMGVGGMQHVPVFQRLQGAGQIAPHLHGGKGGLRGHEAQVHQ